MNTLLGCLENHQLCRRERGIVGSKCIGQVGRVWREVRAQESKLDSSDEKCHGRRRRRRGRYL
jgi:hypothetical protein